MSKVKGIQIPEGLCDCGRAAAKTIINLLRQEDSIWTGGCRTFYTPAEWRARGESYGGDSLLVVVYDGGEVGPYFSMDQSYPHYQQHTRMAETLEGAGYYSEECCTWYSAVYATEGSS